MNIGVWRPHKYVGSVKIYYENVRKQLQNAGVVIIEFGVNDLRPQQTDLYWDPTCTDGKSPNQALYDTKKPLVVTLHGAASFSLKINLQKNRIKYWLKIVRRKWLWYRFPKKYLSVITVSKYAEKEIKDFLPLDHIPFEPIYHGYDSSVFCPDDKIEQSYLLHVSAYQPKKNVENIIAAYRLLPAEKKIPLLLVVPNFPACQPVDGITIIREKKSSSEVAGLMRGARAFVFPSFHESFGMPLVEAMACGCPIVTSTLTACPEIVGDAALLVNPGSVEEIKEAMLKIIENPALEKELRLRSLHRAREFSWEKCGAEHLKLFKSLVEK